MVARGGPRRRFHVPRIEDHQTRGSGSSSVTKPIISRSLLPPVRLQLGNRRQASFSGAPAVTAPGAFATAFQVALVGLVAEREEVEQVGVFQRLLGKVGLRRRHQAGDC